MKTPKLSIIIPAFNESKRIGLTLSSTVEYLKSQDYDYEIIVVSDGSTDETVAVVNEFIRVNEAISVIANRKNRGKGYVVKQGVLASSGDWVLFMDADNATEIKEIERLWPKTNRYQVVFGSRQRAKNTIVKQPWRRQFMSHFSNLMIQWMVGVMLNDTQCGFKLFKREIIDEVFSSLVIERFGFDIEIAAICKLKNIEIAEVPVNWTNVADSKVRAIRDLKRTFIELLTIKDNISKGIYE